MNFRILTPIILGLVITTTVKSQSVDPRLNEISLQNLDAFQQSGTNWKIVGAVQGNFNDSVLAVTNGTGVLFNDFKKEIQFKPGHHLTTKMELGDVVIACDLMLPKGSNSGIYLQSRYEVQLFDSWGIKNPRFSDIGGIYERWKDEKGYEGKAPMRASAFAPGLWQHLEISFQAPRFDKNGNKTVPAKFVYVKLNGVILQENIYVSGPTRAAAFEDEKPYGPIMIQGDHGQLAIKNLKYAPQEALKVQLNDLSYSYYEDKIENPDQATKFKPSGKGKTSNLDSRLASEKDKYFLQFDGTLNVPSKDSYTFTLLHSGDAALEIDGKKIIGPIWNWIGADPNNGKIDLEAGNHKFRFWLHKELNWAPSGISLFIEKPNSMSVALHTPASMPERTPAPLIQVTSESQTEIVRSFMMHQGRKLTHVLSVGHPSKVHYSYDLLQGAMLQVWKGEFLNTTDMWYERGEPQTATAMGASIVMAGKCPIYEKQNEKDSISNYQYKGYVLDPSGQPAFHYGYGKVDIKDQIIPMENGNGLERTMDLSGAGSEALQVRLIQDGAIKSIGKDLYMAGDGKYFLKIIQGSNPVIEDFGGKKLLLVNGSKTVKYQLIW
ncbi:MAG: family 16 glycoside hydrolase [Chitinophagaceae bacterium]